MELAQYKTSEDSLADQYNMFRELHFEELLFDGTD
jgi:hypothetical protein